MKNIVAAHTNSYHGFSLKWISTARKAFGTSRVWEMADSFAYLKVMNKFD